jgi:hypothetical protein
MGKELVVASTPRRSCLSEAWDDEEEEATRVIRNWRIPSGNRNNLKEHLRMWARIVTSSIQ